MNDQEPNADAQRDGKWTVSRRSLVQAEAGIPILGHIVGREAVASEMRAA